MRILYIAVHSHIGWGAEYWLAQAFERCGHEVIRYDYRAQRKKLKPWWYIGRELVHIEQRSRPDVILLQRARSMHPGAIRGLHTPVVFWSTEPLQLKQDVDGLLKTDLFSWLFVHSHGCMQRIEQEFAHHKPHCSVLHNGCPQETLDTETVKSRFAIFNRNLSPRRRQWLEPSADLVEIIPGRFGEAYFNDLATAQVAVNVHFSEQNRDDFESGIFEAMAKGCVVVSERLDAVTVAELGMGEALLQVDSPQQLRQTLMRLRQEPQLVQEYRQRSQQAITANTWDCRARIFLDTFNRIKNQ